ncbi:MAG: hypothetical protein ACRD3T_15785 [Terriglobia bacterium]
MAEGYSSRFWILVSMGVVGVILGVLVWVTHDRATKAASAPAMTMAEKAYLGQIEVANPHMSVATNLMGNTLYYLDADVTNKGSRRIRRLELQLEFFDPFQQVVLRTTENPIAEEDSALSPGKTRHLHVTFEHLPAEWNQGAPSFTPVLVKF